MSAYTPGPWQAHEASQRYGLCIEVTGLHGHPLATLAIRNGMSRAHEYSPPQNEAEANARLIAAAPELFEALSNLLADLAPIANELHNGKINGGWPPTPGDARAVASELARISAPARTALAKAQGAQP